MAQNELELWILDLMKKAKQRTLPQGHTFALY
jgi:hypothetical protein